MDWIELGWVGSIGLTYGMGSSCVNKDEDEEVEVEVRVEVEGVTNGKM